MDDQAEATSSAFADEVLKARAQALLDELSALRQNPGEESIHDTRVQSRRMRAALDAFKESHNRIKSMALVHEKLYRSKNLAGIEISDYIHNLTSYLFQSYGVSADRIERKIFIENIQLGIDTAIPCGLIVNELVSNSLKHAFKEGQKGEIRIELRTIGEGMYRMVIADNGVGMDTSLDLEKRQTLGLQLVNALVKQIDGKIKVESGPGTRYEIEFQEMKYKERK